MISIVYSIKEGTKATFRTFLKYFAALTFGISRNKNDHVKDIES